MENPILRDIEWASVLYTLTSGYDESYVKTMNFLYKYRPFEKRIQEEYTCLGEIIVNFLNQWHTRVPNKSKVRLTEKIRENAHRLDSLFEVSLHEVSESDIKCLYSEFDEIGRFGPTATSKTLHLLCPNTFVMWDEKIKEDFKKRLKNHDGDSQEYVKFMREESERFGTVLSDASVSALNELLEKLSKYDGREFYKKTKAKIIDEYNWLTKTRNVRIPFQISISECIKL